LRYDPKDNKKVTIAFQATHPNNHATFDFDMYRGATYLAAASAAGEVSAASAGAYIGDGVGNFSEDFARATLLGTCAEAAFAERLRTIAKATSGWHRIQAYDASAIRAFALAPKKKGKP
jgi:hypothetical protein